MAPPIELHRTPPQEMEAVPDAAPVNAAAPKKQQDSPSYPAVGSLPLDTEHRALQNLLNGVLVAAENVGESQRNRNVLNNIPAGVLQMFRVSDLEPELRVVIEPLLAEVFNQGTYDLIFEPEFSLSLGLPKFPSITLTSLTISHGKVVDITGPAVKKLVKPLALAAINTVYPNPVALPVPRCTIKMLTEADTGFSGDLELFEVVEAGGINIPQGVVIQTHGEGPLRVDELVVTIPYAYVENVTISTPTGPRAAATTGDDVIAENLVLTLTRQENRRFGLHSAHVESSQGTWQIDQDEGLRFAMSSPLVADITPHEEQGFGVNYSVPSLTVSADHIQGADLSLNDGGLTLNGVTGSAHFNPFTLHGGYTLSFTPTVHSATAAISGMSTTIAETRCDSVDIGGTISPDAPIVKLEANSCHGNHDTMALVSGDFYLDTASLTANGNYTAGEPATIEVSLDLKASVTTNKNSTHGCGHAHTSPSVAVTTHADLSASFYYQDHNNNPLSPDLSLMPQSLTGTLTTWGNSQAFSFLPNVRVVNAHTIRQAHDGAIELVSQTPITDNPTTPPIVLAQAPSDL